MTITTFPGPKRRPGSRAGLAGSGLPRVLDALARLVRRPAAASAAASARLDREVLAALGLAVVHGPSDSRSHLRHAGRRTV